MAMTDGGLNRGLKTGDTAGSVSRAIETLRDEGFAVDTVQDVERADHGVTFGLKLYDPNRSARLGETNDESAEPSNHD